MTQILEGTWEEVVTHAEELKGRKVRVLILSTDFDGTDHGSASREDDDAAEQRRLHEIAVRLAGTVTSLPADLSERAEELWARGVEEKYRRQSL